MSNFALRFKDIKKTAKLIEFINMAKNNPYIEYNTSKRNSLFIKARKLGYDISKIEEQCYTDDIALLSLACMYCGIDEKYFFTAGKCCDINNIIPTLIYTNEFNIVDNNYVQGDIYYDKSKIEII